MSKNVVVKKSSRPTSTGAKPSASKRPVLKLRSTPETAVSAEQRRRMIAETAYAIAEKRRFCGDACLDDWLQAEKIVDRHLQEHSGQTAGK